MEKLDGIEIIVGADMTITVTLPLLPLEDVKLANASFHHSFLMYFLTYQTFVTNLHLLIN